MVLRPNETISVHATCDSCGHECDLHAKRWTIASVLLGEEPMECGACGQRAAWVSFMSPVPEPSDAVRAAKTAYTDAVAAQAAADKAATIAAEAAAAAANARIVAASAWAAWVDASKAASAAAAHDLHAVMEEDERE